MAALLGEIVMMVRPDTRGFLELVDRELAALLNIGSTAAARDRGEVMVASARRLAEADPTNSEAQRDLSISYNKLADLAVRSREIDQACGYYEQDLAIARSLAGADPVNVGKQRDVMISLLQLGRLLSGTGDRERGRMMVSEAAEIAQRIGVDLGLSGDPSRDAGPGDQPEGRRRRFFGRRRR